MLFVVGNEDNYTLFAFAFPLSVSEIDEGKHVFYYFLYGDEIHEAVYVRDLVSAWLQGFPLDQDNARSQLSYAAMPPSWMKT